MAGRARWARSTSPCSRSATASIAANTGNNVYTLTDVVDDAFYQTIWDTGGTDTISYGGALDARIDLTAATLDYSADRRRRRIVPATTCPAAQLGEVKGGYTIANGVVIENATGGSGNDVLIGNAAANVLTGNAGNDILIGPRRQATRSPAAPVDGTQVRRCHRRLSKATRSLDFDERRRHDRPSAFDDLDASDLNADRATLMFADTNGDGNDAHDLDDIVIFGENEPRAGGIDDLGGASADGGRRHPSASPRLRDTVRRREGTTSSAMRVRQDRLI